MPSSPSLTLLLGLCLALTSEFLARAYSFSKKTGLQGVFTTSLYQVNLWQVMLYQITLYQDKWSKRGLELSLNEDSRKM
jgi:hypothetical protein